MEAFNPLAAERVANDGAVIDICKEADAGGQQARGF
jgi:hypothetical protein